MKETSIQILLAEYDRLKALENLHIERCGQILQLYLTVITAAVGVFLFLFESQTPLSAFRLSAGLMLGGVLLLGEITYLRLMAEDIVLIAISKRYRLIQEKFIGTDSELSSAFPERLAQDAKRFHFWSSIRGVIGRGFAASGHKTTTVLLNCLAFVGASIVVVRPGGVWVALATGVGTGVVVGILHVLYASWRYRRTFKHLATDVVAWWV